MDRMKCSADSRSARVWSSSLTGPSFRRMVAYAAIVQTLYLGSDIDRLPAEPISEIFGELRGILPGSVVVGSVLLEAED